MGKYTDSFLRTFKRQAQALSNLENILDLDVMDKAADLIADCKGSIILCGCGSSGTVAFRGMSTLNFVYRPAHCLSVVDAPHGDFGMIREGDILICISKGGNTKEIVDAIPIAKKLGATVIGITEGKDSKIANMADVAIISSSGHECDDWDMVATTSTTTSMVILDALTIAAMNKNGIGPRQFALIHPGGAVGEMLKGGNDDK